MNPPTANQARLLIYGYGNPGRQDDGLGVFLVDRLQPWAAAQGLSHVSFESSYQLNIEDALRLLEAEVVVFVDASAAETEPFSFREIRGAGAIPFTTHALAPEAVLALCQQLYGRCPVAFLLTLRGLAWEPNQPLSAAAESHLALAERFLAPWLRRPWDRRAPCARRVNRCDPAEVRPSRRKRAQRTPGCPSAQRGTPLGSDEGDTRG